MNTTFDIMNTMNIFDSAMDEVDEGDSNNLAFSVMLLDQGLDPNHYFSNMSTKDAAEDNVFVSALNSD